MNPQPIKTPPYIAKNLLFGEYAIYRCKAHKAIWIMPLILVLGCLSFIFSYPDIENDTLVAVYLGLAISAILLIVYTFIYATTEILLTNQRLVIRQSFNINYIELKNVGILKCEDGVAQMEDINSRYKAQKRSLDIAFSIFFDIVRVHIIDKNGSNYASLYYIGLYNYKQLKKLYDEECEKQENNNFSYNTNV